MLKKITCDKFTQKEINFHSGLNAILGDDVATNSIGKTTMLMIVDFVFGGNDYIKVNHDTVENLGHHEFQFIYEFSKKKYYFTRNTETPQIVSICDNNFMRSDSIKNNEFCAWLQKKYDCELEDLSFRDIVGRYFRIYGKENLNEKKPIQYFEKETQKNSIISLIKLFDKYKLLKSYEEQVQDLKEKISLLKRASGKNLITTVTNKTNFNKNEKEIEKLKLQIENLKKEMANISLDIESLISKEVLELKNQRSQLSVKKNILESRLTRTQSNLKNKSIKKQIDFSRFIEYFNDFNIEKVEKVDRFHNNIVYILKDELKQTQRELTNEIKLINFQIETVDSKIAENFSENNAPQFAIETIIDLSTSMVKLEDQNNYYKLNNSYKDQVNEIEDNYEVLKTQTTNDISNQINTYLDKLNNYIYRDGRRSPTFNINNNSYSFVTSGDTGTGTAFSGLIAFDLSLLKLTKLPALIHDLPLLKNIENSAMENIIKLYSDNTKQVFIAIDKLNSYNKATIEILEKHKVLKLSKTQLLFIKNWKNK